MLSIIFLAWLKKNFDSVGPLCQDSETVSFRMLFIDAALLMSHTAIAPVEGWTVPVGIRAALPTTLRD